MAPYLARKDFMGVIGVQRDGGAPLLFSYGLASVELGMPHATNSIFNIGSVSKHFTAAAILLLEEDGALTTGDEAGKYFPDCAHGNRVTIEQLLTHTSGVADTYSLRRFGDTNGQAGTFQQVVADLCASELHFEPGSTYAYSNGGYVLLAAIIEKASGLAYGEFLERRLFAPLGMTSSSQDGPGPATRHRVPGYDPWGTADLTPALPLWPAYSTGAGSLSSSAADLLTWAEALHTGRVLSNASYQKLVRDYGYGYGFGLSIFKRLGHRAIGHDGRGGGFASDLARYPDDGVSIVVLSNVQSVARDEIRSRVAASVFGKDPGKPGHREFLQQNDVPEAELTGVYAFGPNFRVTVFAADGRLMARANEGGSSELVPLAQEVWFSRMLYATIRFGRDAAGTVDRVIWGLSENAPVGRKIE